MQQKVRGLVLKQRNIGEDDRILTILTDELGLIEAAARRVKSPKSTLKAAAQPLSYAEFCLYRGRQSTYIIDAAEPLNTFYTLRFDVQKLALADYFCELTCRLSPAPDCCPDLLRLLLNSLHLLEAEKAGMEQLKATYELRSLSLAGFMPNLVGCTLCGQFERETMYFLPLEGVLLCGDCLPGSAYADTRVIRAHLPAPVLAAMRHVVFSEPERVFSFRLGGDSLEQFGRIAEAYVRLQTECEFKSLNIYHALELAPVPAPAADR